MPRYALVDPDDLIHDIIVVPAHKARGTATPSPSIAALDARAAAAGDGTIVVEFATLPGGEMAPGDRLEWDADAQQPVIVTP